MKTRSRLALAAGLIALSVPPAALANDALLGALVGAGAGALLGQAIGGRDGAIAGGMVGAVAGAASSAPHAVVGVATPVHYTPQVVYSAPGYYAPVYGGHPAYGHGYVYNAPPPVVVYRSAPVVVITNEHRHRHGHWHGHGHRHWHR